MNHYTIHNTGEYYNIHYGNEHIESFRVKGTVKRDLKALLDHVNENIDQKLILIGKLMIENPAAVLFEKDV
tara:strand:+ start:2181 stop:2393 length:213 start_codon:yes stop_codon:yes gene_type:complete